VEPHEKDVLDEAYDQMLLCLKPFDLSFRQASNALRTLLRDVFTWTLDEQDRKAKRVKARKARKARKD
jgi:hypothetical protein